MKKFKVSNVPIVVMTETEYKTALAEASGKKRTIDKKGVAEIYGVALSTLSEHPEYFPFDDRGTRNQLYDADIIEALAYVGKDFLTESYKKRVGTRPCKKRRLLDACRRLENC